MDVSVVVATEANLRASRIKTSEKEALQSVGGKRSPSKPLLPLQTYIVFALSVHVKSAGDSEAAAPLWKPALNTQGILPPGASLLP